MTVRAPHLPRPPCSGPQGEEGKGSEPRQMAQSLTPMGLTKQKNRTDHRRSHPSLRPQPASSPFSSETPCPVPADKQAGHLSAWPQASPWEGGLLSPWEGGSQAGTALGQAGPKPTSVPWVSCPLATKVGRKKWLVFSSQHTMNTEKVKHIPKKIF